MDIIDIALGGSRGKKLSEPVAIDLDAYGISVPNIVANNGPYNESINHGSAMWDQIDSAKGNVVGVFELSGNKITLFPTAYTWSQLSLSFTGVNYGVLIKCDVTLVRAVSGNLETVGTNIYAVISSTSFQ